MFRRWTFLVALAVALVGCANPSVEDVAVGARSGAQISGDSSSSDSESGEVFGETTLPSVEPIDAVDPGIGAIGPPYFLPDPNRWVVFEERKSPNGDVTQLDVAPLDAAGVPDLRSKLSLRYIPGAVESFDRVWGDTSGFDEPFTFEFPGGVGRAVEHDAINYSAATVHIDRVFVAAQAQHGDVDLVELLSSLIEVDQQTWDATRAAAEDQQLRAIEVAMESIDVPPADAEPLPHWILPEPWEPIWVTDKTIWTDEQWAQSHAHRELRGTQPEYFAGKGRLWHFGFADTADEAAMQFAPDLSVYVSVYDGDAPPPFHPQNFDQISALGLEGVISPVMGGGGPIGQIAELGTGDVRAHVMSHGLDESLTRAFLDAAQLGVDPVVDSLVVADARFQWLELGFDTVHDLGSPREFERDPPSWHAAWQSPDHPDARMSVSRMSVQELRERLANEEWLNVPVDVWETVATGGVIDFGNQATYDVATGLLVEVHGIDAAELIPIELDDWIALVEPYNTDPLNPR